MKLFGKISLDTVVAIIGLLFAFVVYYTGCRKDPNCDEQNKTLATLFDDLSRDINTNDKTLKLFANFEKDFRNKVEEFKSSGCVWNKDLILKRENAVANLWESAQIILKNESLTKDDIKLFRQIIEDIKLVCATSEEACSTIDKSFIEKMDKNILP